MQVDVNLQKFTFKELKKVNTEKKAIFKEKLKQLSDILSYKVQPSIKLPEGYYERVKTKISLAPLTNQQLGEIADVFKKNGLSADYEDILIRRQESVDFRKDTEHFIKALKGIFYPSKVVLSSSEKRTFLTLHNFLFAHLFIGKTTLGFSGNDLESFQETVMTAENTSQDELTEARILLDNPEVQERLNELKNNFAFKKKVMADKGPLNPFL